MGCAAKPGGAPGSGGSGGAPARVEAPDRRRPGPARPARHRPPSPAAARLFAIPRPFPVYVIMKRLVSRPDNVRGAVREAPSHATLPGPTRPSRSHPPARMSSFRRLAILSLALAGGLGFLGLPGRTDAQTSHFAFADTTVLRDTLGLHFDHIIEASDSLQRQYGRDLSPDSLRAHIIRYRLPLQRLLTMADSMHV